MQTVSTWLELIGMIGEKNADIARLYGLGMLDDSDLLAIVPQRVAEEIQRFFIVEEKIS